MRFQENLPGGQVGRSLHSGIGAMSWRRRVQRPVGCAAPGEQLRCPRRKGGCRALGELSGTYVGGGSDSRAGVASYGKVPPCWRMQAAVGDGAVEASVAVGCLGAVTVGCQHC